MRTYVVYFYLAIGAMRNSLKNDDDLFVLGSSPLVGLIDHPGIQGNSRKERVTNLKLRPFEIQQDRLDGIIKFAPNLDMKILDIEFDNSGIDPDLEEEIYDAINAQNNTELLQLVHEARAEGHDIFAITFLYAGRQYRVTKYAVAEISGEWNELPSLAETSPISFIAGLKKFPAERAGTVG